MNFIVTALDLHVLGISLAFILSQDQTPILSNKNFLFFRKFFLVYIMIVLLSLQQHKKIVIFEKVFRNVFIEITNFFINLIGGLTD